MCTRGRGEVSSSAFSYPISGIMHNALCGGNVEVAINPHLRHPLILGTNWPAFNTLLGVLCVDASWGKEMPRGETAVRTGEAEPGPAEAAPGEWNAVERLILPEWDDFLWSSLRTSRSKMLSIKSVPLTVSLSSPHGPLLIPILLF